MPDEERLAEILAAWQEAHDRGDAPTVEAVALANPDLADEIREVFSVLELIDHALLNDAGPAPTPARIGPFRMLSRLGSGAMGTVYLAEAAERAAGLEAGTRVAVKVMKPALLRIEGFFKRFLREAQAGMRIRHPGVTRTLDADLVVVGDTPYCYLVMEYVEGDSLRALADRLGLFPEPLAREIAREAARALAAVHAEGIVHRDLKPEHMILTTDGGLKLMDLGVAKMEEAVRISQSGIFVGSLRYASPEQLLGSRAVDHRADLYALGMVLYELTAGAHPFPDDDMQEFFERALAADPEPLRSRRPAVSPGFAAIVHALLAKDPSERPRSAEALLALLEAPVGPELPPQPQPPPPPPAAGLAALEDELAALAPEDREALAAAAAAGETFDAHAVARALGRPPLTLLRDLAFLERETALLTSRGSRYAFASPAAREALLRG